MESQRTELQIGEAGCMILVAPLGLGGLAYEELLDGPFSGNSSETLQDLTERGAMMAMSLYQDDGYNVRVVHGDLNEQERDEWVARTRGHLRVPCGKLLVAGALDHEDEIPEAKDGDKFWFGCCYVAIPPGDYQAEVLSYPPGDLSTGWGQITNTSLFPPGEGIEPESEHDYWQRTRPQEEPPPWITEGWDPEGRYITFVLHLTPLADAPRTSDFEDDGFLKWEFRKPELCPRGLLASSLKVRKT